MSIGFVKTPVRPTIVERLMQGGAWADNEQLTKTSKPGGINKRCVSKRCDRKVSWAGRPRKPSLCPAVAFSALTCADGPYTAFQRDESDRRVFVVRFRHPSQ